MTRFTKHALTAIFLALGLVPLKSEAFIFLTGGSYNAGARPVSHAPVWSGRTLQFRINTNQSAYSGSTTPDVSSAEFLAAATAAVQAWANVCGSNVSVSLVGTTTNVFSSGDGVNTILWDNRTTAGGNIIADTNVLAVAASSTSTDTQTSCDIIVNGELSGNFAVNGSASRYDLVGALVHEIGHCLGLDHSVYPPTYTSNNPILTYAVMRGFVDLGDLTMRTLSQDEVDAMECVYPTSLSLRSGNYCTSYHGTNGGAAISGVVSGGPSSTRTCGDGQSASVTASSESGSGCVTNAIAGSSRNESREVPAPERGGFGFWPCLLLALLAKLFWNYRRAKSVAALLVLLSLTSNAEAAIELGARRTWAKPANLNTGSGLSSSEGTYTTTKSDPTSGGFEKFDELALALTTRWSPNLSLGLSFTKSQEEDFVIKGYNSSDVLQITKTSSLSGWTLGLLGRYYFYPSDKDELNFYFEGELGLGPLEYKQTIVDTSAATNRVTASAFALRSDVFLGTVIPVFGMISANLKVGYSRVRSNYFSADEVVGTRYSSVSAGKRLALRNGSPLLLERSGLLVFAGLSFSF